MGLSASQARFLQLTARKSNVEYQAQQINFQRLQLSDKLAQASADYQDKMSNRKMMYTFNNGSEVQKVDLTYTNYKTFMNQLQGAISSSQDRYYLVSSTGNKLVVSSEEERDLMMEQNTTRYLVSDIEKAKAEVEAAEAEGTLSDVSSYTKKLAAFDLTNYEKETITDEDGNEVDYYLDRKFGEKDFMIADDLDDVDNFQKAIQDGVYYFAQYKENSQTGEKELRTQGWDTLGQGAIVEEYDKTDDAQAEAEYKALQDKAQNVDKKLELQLNKLETERSAIETEIESVSKVIDDNIEGSFKVFS